MKFIDDIFSLVWDIAEWFWQLYYESQDIPIVGGVISGIFLAIYKVVRSLLSPIAQFGDWVDDVAAKVSNVLGPEGIISLLKTWLTYAENAWAWIQDAALIITNYTNTWWSSASLTVQGWIDIAKQALQNSIETVSKSLAALRTSWDDFRTLTLPTLISAIDTSKLIDSTLKRWFPDYDDLVKLWADTKLFFTNPLDWLWDRFTDWFLGRS